MMIAAISAATSLLLFSLVAAISMRRRSASRILSSLDDMPDESWIVILGCPTRGPSGEANRYFVARIAAAAAAYHHASARGNPTGHNPSRLLCSGWDGQGEASELRDALIAARVPASQIIVDGGARRTIDTIDHVEAHAANTSILFVSQAFHLPRVLYLARNRGIDAWGLPAQGKLKGLRPHLREALAQLRAIVDLKTRQRSG
jgi:SanA protein